MNDSQVDSPDRTGGAAVWTSLSLATLTVLGFGLVAWLAQRSPDQIPIARLLPLFLLLAVPGLILAGLLPRLSGRVAPLWLVFLVGVLIRVLFCIPEPFLSDDVYRYVWDGRVQVAGHLPYGIAPDDWDLDSVEESWAPEERVRDLVNHPDVPTIYPPVLELVFWGVAAAGGGLPLWRLLLLFVELCVAGCLVALLRRWGRDPRLVVLYLWHPLPVFESVWSAHAEVIPVLFALLGLLWLPFGTASVPRGLASAAGFALGGAAKLIPFGLLPWLVWHLAHSEQGQPTSPRRVRWGRALAWTSGCGAVAVGVVVATAWPYRAVDLESAFAGLSAYAEGWYFNDVFYRAVGFALGLDPEDRTLASTQWLRRGFQITGVLVCMFVAFRVRDGARAGLWIGGGFVLLTPTLHPWYMLWVLPFAILVGSRGWILLSVTVLASYLVQVGWREYGAWSELSWLRWLGFGPPLGLLLWDGLRRSRAAAAAASP